MKQTCGNTKKRLNHIYNGMKARCYKQNCNGFERYEGIGITVCEEWFNNDIVTINNVHGAWASTVNEKLRGVRGQRLQDLKKVPPAFSYRRLVG